MNGYKLIYGVGINLAAGEAYIAPVYTREDDFLVDTYGNGGLTWQKVFPNHTSLMYEADSFEEALEYINREYEGFEIYTIK